MAVSVAMPGWKPEKQEKPKKDALDIIQQGLQAAAAAYGIYADSQKLDLAKQAQADSKTKQAADIGNIEAQTTLHKAQAAAIANKPDPEDALTQKDQANLIKDGFLPARDNDPNAIPFAVKGGKTKWYMPPSAKPEALSANTAEYLADDGKVRIGSVVTSKSGKVEFRRSANDPLAPKQPETAIGGMPKMNESERVVVDKSASGLEAIADMRDAINSVAGRSGIRQASERVKIMSDTPFTEARTRYTEAIGRLQSGGAINKDEAERFNAMAPGPLDSYAMAQIKLNKAYTDLAARLKSRGVDPEQAMAQRRELSRQAPQLAPERTGGAQAAPSSGPQPGMIENGYRFRGGNPADPNSWEKI